MRKIQFYKREASFFSLPDGPCYGAIYFLFSLPRFPSPHFFFIVGMFVWIKLLGISDSRSLIMEKAMEKKVSTRKGIWKKGRSCLCFLAYRCYVPPSTLIVCLCVLLVFRVPLHSFAFRPSKNMANAKVANWRIVRFAPCARQRTHSAISALRLHVNVNIVNFTLGIAGTRPKLYAQQGSHTVSTKKVFFFFFCSFENHDFRSRIFLLLLLLLNS